ncbi:MAG: phasin family protein [Pseudomonadota bacterium]|nr:phasin family protein [Pseudomonadota bacterium]
MATKSASKSPSGPKSSGAKRSRSTGAGTRGETDGSRGAEARSTASASSQSASGAMGAMPGAGANPFAAFADPAQLAKLKALMTPEQAFELYRQNARLALEIIDASIESTAKLRKLQFASEEEARNMHKRAARRAAEAENPQALMATSQNVSQEAVQSAMAYWGQMFELIVEMQKRLFLIMDNQVADVPGVKQAKAAMGMLPDLSQAQNLVQAMQGVFASGGTAFESMQRVMGDFTRMAQNAVPGAKR